jgi:hypothetical protein
MLEANEWYRKDARNQINRPTKTAHNNANLENVHRVWAVGRCVPMLLAIFAEQVVIRTLLQEGSAMPVPAQRPVVLKQITAEDVVSGTLTYLAHVFTATLRCHLRNLRHGRLRTSRDGRRHGWRRRPGIFRQTSFRRLLLIPCEAFLEACHFTF